MQQETAAKEQRREAQLKIEAAIAARTAAAAGRKSEGKAVVSPPEEPLVSNATPPRASEAAGNRYLVHFHHSWGFMLTRKVQQEPSAMSTQRPCTC